ncbi:MAG TPA: hypothetical protein VGR63_04170 [Casimicrobiaceae bacterium]|nr:hypothetical protein [Casimicrobiaceae bacterium]
MSAGAHTVVLPAHARIQAMAQRQLLGGAHIVVIPAHAATQAMAQRQGWIPACAGMTVAVTIAMHAIRGRRR